MKKRSEFERESEKYWMKAQEDGVVLGGTIRCLVLRDVYAAERAGVVWDPEKTEVVWRSGSIRLNAYGSWEVDYSGSDRWTKMEVSNTFAPVYAELARRFLAEKESVLNLDCDGPIIPGELADNPAFKAVWAIIERWSNPIPTGHHVLKILRALRDAGVTIPAKREHVTDGGPCWCNPVTERPDASAGRSESPRFARITKASKVTYWYAKAIGRVFQILGEDPSHFMALSSGGVNWWVDREDCEMVSILRQWPDHSS